ncbi:hypothetical protein F183_A48380 [Bryobacterales bacterium F-183]|nr:hypothetical protein F183_A48380 [Bryobacterales bacterium F-183]
MRYTRLSRKKRSIFGSVQLWLGDDHLLVVRSMRFTEEYRRFHLRDIQAITATEQPQLIWMEVALFAISALAFLMMLEVEAIAARIFFGVVGAALASTAVYDLVRGQRCRCRLLTEVSSEVLDPITRVSDFDRLTTQLEPAIAAVQGVLTVDAASMPVFAQPAPGTPPLRQEDRVETPAGKYIPLLLYFAILANAIAYAAGLLGRFNEGFGAAASFWFTEVILCVLLAFQPRRFGLKGPMLGFFYVTAALIAIDGIVTIALIVDLMQRIAEAGRSGTKTPTIWNIEWMMTAGKIAIAGRSLLGVVGLLALWLGRDRVVPASEEVPPSQPQP